MGWVVGAHGDTPIQEGLSLPMGPLREAETR